MGYLRCVLSEKLNGFTVRGITIPRSVHYDVTASRPSRVNPSGLAALTGLWFAC